ncbi:MAG: hypothetical protein M9962_14060 [Oligoflexia bacterium]|nr:hypothetical protein [Oligoflexia bacterium]
MQGRMWFLLGSLLILSSCASKSLLTADCHSCTIENQTWSDLEWKDLHGKWSGSLDTATRSVAEQKNSKPKKASIPVSLEFVEGKEFLAKNQIAKCSGLNDDFVVLNGTFLNERNSENEFDVFAKDKDGDVGYGKISFKKLNGDLFCDFERIGGKMKKNRLDLPSLSFQWGNPAQIGRSIASVDQGATYSIEILRMKKEEFKNIKFDEKSRKPASSIIAEKPTLIFRVVKNMVSREEGSDRWTGATEQLYRLWPKP